MRSLLVLAATVAVLSAWLASAETPSTECPEKPYVVMIHADWCGKCRAFESTWIGIKDEFDESATFLKLDVTDRVAYENSRAEAKRRGFSKFFMKYRSQSGTVAVLDCATHETVAIVTGERDPSKYREAISRATQSF